MIFAPLKYSSVEERGGVLILQQRKLSAENGSEKYGNNFKTLTKNDNKRFQNQSNFRQNLKKKNRSVSSQEIYIFVLCVYIVIIKTLEQNLTLRFVLRNNIYFNKKVFFVALYTITVQPAVLELDGSHKAENM